MLLWLPNDFHKYIHLYSTDRFLDSSPTADGFNSSSVNPNPIIKFCSWSICRHKSTAPGSAWMWTEMHLFKQSQFVFYTRVQLTAFTPSPNKPYWTLEIFLLDRSRWDVIAFLYISSWYNQKLLCVFICFQVLFHRASVVDSNSERRNIKLKTVTLDDLM